MRHPHTYKIQSQILKFIPLLYNRTFHFPSPFLSHLLMLQPDCRLPLPEAWAHPPWKPSEQWIFCPPHNKCSASHWTPLFFFFVLLWDSFYSELLRKASKYFVKKQLFYVHSKTSPKSIFLEVMVSCTAKLWNVKNCTSFHQLHMRWTCLFQHTSHSDVKFYLLFIQEIKACTDIYTF